MSSKILNISQWRSVVPDLVMKGNITIDSTNIANIRRDYHQSLYANKLDNLGKIEEVSEIYELAKFTQK